MMRCSWFERVRLLSRKTADRIQRKLVRIGNPLSCATAVCLLLSLSGQVHAVGNEVFEDSAEATEEGFRALDVDRRGDSVRFQLRAPTTYDFDELGEMELVGISFLIRESNEEVGALLIGAKSVVPIAWEQQEQVQAGVTDFVMLRTSDALPHYFEFAYAGEGHIPMLVHIPCCTLLGC